MCLTVRVLLSNLAVEMVEVGHLNESKVLRFYR